MNNKELIQKAFDEKVCVEIKTTKVSMPKVRMILEIKDDLVVHTNTNDRNDRRVVDKIENITSVKILGPEGYLESKLERFKAKEIEIQEPQPYKRKIRRHVSKRVQGVEDTAKKICDLCSKCLDDLKAIRQFKEDFLQANFTDWKGLATAKKENPIRLLLETYADNRGGSAEAHIRLIEGLERLEKRLKSFVFGRRIMGPVSSLASSFMYVAPKIKEEARNVVRSWKMGFHKQEFVLQTLHANNHFTDWVTEKSKEADGLVDITEYKPDKDSFDLKKILSLFIFRDIAIAKISLNGQDEPREDMYFYDLEESLSIILKETYPFQTYGKKNLRA